MSGASPGAGSFLGRFWRGDVPLWKAFTFTLSWGLVLVFVGYLLLANLPRLLVIFSVFTALIGFGIGCSVAIWRAAGKSDRPWKRIAAKTAVAIGLVTASVWIGSFVWSTYGALDLSTNSRTIEATIEYDPALPLIGFWKIDCANDFGFVLEKASPEEYSVRFCGPGGCMSRSVWRTTVVGDPLFRVFEDGTLGFRADDKTLDGVQRDGIALRDGLLPLRRCPTSPKASEPDTQTR